MAELPHRLIHFIHTCVPTYQAAEVLLFFAARPEQAFTAEDVVVSMRPLVVTVPAVEEYIAVFTSHRLIVERAGMFAYGPATDDLDGAVRELERAYNERPVTLVNVIYAIADSRIRSFADAFRLRKD